MRNTQCRRLCGGDGTFRRGSMAAAVRPHEASISTSNEMSMKPSAGCATAGVGETSLAC